MPPENFVRAGVADVSAIMPAWRAQATIGRALASIAAQTIPPREAIVVDDGSDDGTAKAAEACGPRLAAAGIALKVVRQPHLGPGAARNRAIVESSGAWLAFLDADDEWLPAKIERSLAVAAESGADILSHNYLTVDGGRETPADCARHCPPGADPFTAQLLRGFIATITVMARRDLVLRGGGFDSSLRSGQDYDLWLALLALPGTGFRVFPEALARYHITADSVSSRVGLRREAALAILARHWRCLRGRTRAPLGTAFLRVLIIHAQAAAMHTRRSEFRAAAGAAFRIPMSLLMTLASPPPQVRPNYLIQP